MIYKIWVWLSVICNKFIYFRRPMLNTILEFCFCNWKHIAEFLLSRIFNFRSLIWCLRSSKLGLKFSSWTCSCHSTPPHWHSCSKDTCIWLTKLWALVHHWIHSSHHRIHSHHWIHAAHHWIHSHHRIHTSHHHWISCHIHSRTHHIGILLHWSHLSLHLCFLFFHLFIDVHLIHNFI